MLVGIHHHAGVGTGSLSDDHGAADVTLGILGSNLQLHCGESCSDCLFAVLAHLLIGVVEPSHRGVIPGVSVFEDLHPRFTGSFFASEQGDCLGGGQLILEIGKIERGDKLLGGQVEQELPERHPALLGPEIPAGIGYRGERQMDDALVGPEPAELLLVGHLVLQLSEIRHDLLDVVTAQTGRIELGRAAGEVISLTKGEGKTGSGVTGIIGEQRDGVGVDRILVDGIAAMSGADGESCIARGDILDHWFSNEISEIDGPLLDSRKLRRMEAVVTGWNFFLKLAPMLVPLRISFQESPSRHSRVNFPTRFP